MVMRRVAAVFVVWGVVLAGCAGYSGESTTAESPSSTDQATTTLGDATTAVTVPSTTTAAASTTAPATTTASAARPVTVDPNLPDAESGDLVDWDAVGPGWTLALYDATDLGTWDPAPTVLYLVDPSGTRYEVGSWPTFPYPDWIVDWAGTGDTALLPSILPPSEDRVALIVDLRTGAVTGSITLPDDSYARPVSFTTPTGRNLVVLADDGVTQRVERRDRSGSLLAVLSEQSVPADAGDGLGWLYGFDGTFALVKHSGGIDYVDNDGTFVRSLWTPMAHRCWPARWWTADSFLARCTGEGPAFPHEYYSQLWILKTDGTAGTPLNEIPSDPILNVDFGLVNAWPTATGTLAQSSGDCGAGTIDEIAADGSFSSIGVGGTGNDSLISVEGDHMVVLESNECDGADARLIETDLSGAVIRELVPRIGNAWGVRDAATLSTVYP